MVLVVVHAVLAALAVLVALPIAVAAYRRDDRKVFGVTYGDAELTDQVFHRA